MRVIGLKVKVLESKGPVLEFMIEGTDPAFANSLRRIMIAEVPTMAIQWADIHDNNSALFDEVLSHRLGMIPLKFDPRKFNFSEDCKCKGKGCPLCEVAFVLDVKGPALVTSGDLKASNKAVAPTDPRIPITELLEGQAVKLEAVARLGTGMQHAKHQAANASYQYYPQITFKGARDEALKALKAAPEGSYGVEGHEIVIKDLSKTDMFKGLLDGVHGVEMKPDETRLVFKVESISGLEPAYIVAKAAEILGERAAEFRKVLQRI